MTPAQGTLDPYTSPRAFHGGALRQLREQAGLSQDQLGERVFCSGTCIGQFESSGMRARVRCRIRHAQVAFFSIQLVLQGRPARRSNSRCKYCHACCTLLVAVNHEVKEVDP